jgi:hypothetical protein
VVLCPAIKVVCSMYVCIALTLLGIGVDPDHLHVHVERALLAHTPVLAAVQNDLRRYPI